MSLIADVIDRVLFPNREIHSIPVLDGPFSPNRRLDDVRMLGAPIVAPDDLALGPDGALYVSSADTVIRCDGPDFADRAVFARLPDHVGGLAWTRDGRLLACVSGAGLVALSSEGEAVGRLDSVAGRPVACPTAVAVADDGSVFLTEGSRANRPEDWLLDLMQRRAASGRLVACSSALTDSRVLADGLDWPAGLTVSLDNAEVWVCESWAHRLTAFNRQGGRRRLIVRNYAGYPTRIAADPANGYWLAYMGLRTQLVEFVLREREFCEAMMATVPRELWIAPSLDGRFSYLEPTQIGRIKKLGIQKPWAPPRSYGLVARLDRQGEAVESLHSRVDGRIHGVTAVRRIGNRVLAVAKGRDCLVELPDVNGDLQ